MVPALLALEDGSLFSGQSIGVPGSAVGEVVFNTAMTGYQEILTDPSYARQIVTLTYPQIGNTGVNREDVESGKVWASGLVIRQTPRRASSWRAHTTLQQYLAEENVVAIADVDTRRLTRLIRQKGALAGCIAAGPGTDADRALAAARAFPGLPGMDLAKVVTRPRPEEWHEGAWRLDGGYSTPEEPRLHVVAYDFGVKRNILRLLTARGCRVTILPATATAEQALAYGPDGIFLSNGPGDPEPCDYAIRSIGQLMDAGLPMFGICLGHQLMALASGAKTVKMPHGHHGANHPVQDLDTGRVVITSQNHGFADDGDSLPDAVQITHVSLFDGTVQGIRCVNAPAFGFQGHPEASPGPQDCGYLFDRFVDLMASAGAAPNSGASE